MTDTEPTWPQAEGPSTLPYGTRSDGSKVYLGLAQPEQEFVQPATPAELPPLPPQWSETQEAVAIEKADEREARRTGGTFAGRYLVPEEPEDVRRERDIIMREAGRNAAILQVCRWATDPSTPVAIRDGDGEVPELIQLIAGLQYDYFEEPEEQTLVYGLALLVLAKRWYELPVDGRTLVEIALIPPNHAGQWSQLRPTLSTGMVSSARLQELAEDFARTVLGL